VSIAPTEERAVFRILRETSASATDLEVMLKKGGGGNPSRPMLDYRGTALPAQNAVSGNRL